MAYITAAAAAHVAEKMKVLGAQVTKVARVACRTDTVAATATYYH